MAAAMFDAFGVMRQLHELRWHLTEARARVAGSPLEGDLDAALAPGTTISGWGARPAHWAAETAPPGPGPGRRTGRERRRGRARD
ncbi:hypothetical protein SAMN05661080_04662 [Modestobacter sp. DSM 44400]|uniref:hypothetical protein n=1 Tax=Modestobacter sp. DSM 44400 TaxID=1550230 RepID=UPI00089823AD|nr:hypothetical protein [Modestobacter sp. DSM 44400]SDY80587.1 hypothetical protein SAMN05661080_04662 [Modestobacter sp. DSM 44400]